MRLFLGSGSGPRLQGHGAVAAASFNMRHNDTVNAIDTLYVQEAVRAFKEMARLSLAESSRGAPCPLPEPVLVQYLAQQVPAADFSSHNT